MSRPSSRPSSCSTAPGWASREALAWSLTLGGLLLLVFGTAHLFGRLTLGTEKRRSLKKLTEGRVCAREVNHKPLGYRWHALQSSEQEYPDSPQQSDS